MAGMNFGGMVDFVVGQNSDNLSLKVNSSIENFSALAPEFPGKGSSLTSYASLALVGGAGLSLAIPGLEWAAPALLSGSVSLSNTSTALGALQAGIHLKQYIYGDGSALNKAEGDLTELAIGAVAGKMGGKTAGTERSFTKLQNEVFQQIGNASGGASVSAIYDLMKDSPVNGNRVFGRTFSPADATFVAPKIRK